MEPNQRPGEATRNDQPEPAKTAAPSVLNAASAKIVSIASPAETAISGENKPIAAPEPTTQAAKPAPGPNNKNYGEKRNGKAKQQTEERRPAGLMKRVVAATAIIGIGIFAGYTSNRIVENKETRTDNSANEKALALLAANPIIPEAKKEAEGTVKAYFNNGILDPEADCEDVFPVTRTAKNISTGTAFQALLVGPTSHEGDEGYYTSISPGVIINRIDVAGDKAIVDFGEHLAYHIEPNSCRARAIKAQIRETAKEALGVRDILITIEGRGENVFNQ